MDIRTFTHPEYDANIQDWTKYRLTFEGGQAFIDKYLYKYSVRELESDFIDRKKLSYCTSHAKSAVVDIKNSIYQRMSDISRNGGDATYTNAVAGKDSGVDLKHNTMNSFIGRQILPELLAIGKVGIFVDKKPLTENDLLSENPKPYLYKLPAENIRSWAEDDFGNLVSVLVSTMQDIVDPVTRLIIDQEEVFRHFMLTDSGTVVTVFDKDSNVIVGPYEAEINVIPLAVLRLSQSLFQDISNYQIALLNMSSSDVNYCVKANFPVYTEQFHGRTDHTMFTNSGNALPDEEGNRKQDVTIGTTQGRRYPVGTERPMFIHPSSEPVRASMEKQEQMRKEIRQIVNLSVSNIQPTRSSAESKEYDNRSLESGLSYIGLELEYGENIVAKIWGEYQNQAPASVKYPRTYNLKTDDDRIALGEKMVSIRKSVPGISYKKKITEAIIDTTVGHLSSPDELETMKKELREAVTIETDPETLRKDHEAGFVSTDLASKLRGYPEGESAQAAIDHAERAARIVKAQMRVRDMQDPDFNRKEKEESRNTDLELTTEPRVRGEADVD